MKYFVSLIYIDKFYVCIYRYEVVRKEIIFYFVVKLG